MSQDSKEIKTIEQWRWSEMQGIDLLPSSNLSSTTPENNPHLHRESKTAPKVIEHKIEKEMEVAEGKKDGSEKPKEAPPAVGFQELFRFADGLDYILMGIGSLGAFVHGCSLPLFLRFFADLVNSFGSYANNPDKMMQEVLKVHHLIKYFQKNLTFLL